MEKELQKKVHQKKNNAKVSDPSSTKTKATNKNTDSDLLNHVIHLTGIPANIIKRDLKKIMDRKNLDPKTLTLDQLRSVVASYVRETMASLLEPRSGDKLRPDPYERH